VYTQSGQYTQRLTSASGCDSILTLRLTIGGYQSTDTVTACDHYTWRGQTYSGSGDYTVRSSSSGGCDSLLQLHLTVYNSIRTTIDTAVCEGQTYYGYSLANTYIDTFALPRGCDSIRTLHLRIKPPTASGIKATICEGETYLGYTQSGTYQDRFAGVNGCDSIRTLELVVVPKKYTTLDVAICQGEKYFAGGAYQTRTGTYTDTLLSRAGCDSILTTHLLVHPGPAPELGPAKNLCTGTALLLTPGSYPFYLWSDGSTSPQVSILSPGRYWVQVWDDFKCTASDTIQIMNSIPPPSDFLSAADSICSGEKVELKPRGVYSRYSWSTGSAIPAIKVDKPGTYELTVWDANGCMGKDTTTIFPKQCFDGVAIPTAFTPNGDGLNDEFKARVPANIVSFKLEVYNRYGEVVFTTTDPQRGWNGFVKNRIVSTTLFVWQCFYQLQGQPPGYQKGTVLLMK
jgi:gliding motility-associated-like protein